MTAASHGAVVPQTLTSYRPLGLLRFALAFCVFFAHTNVVYNPLLWAYPAIEHVELANIGVWGFFVVSGYIVVRALEGFYASRPSAFLINRALRIFPLFVTCLVLAWAIPIATGTPTIDPGVSPRISVEGLGIGHFLLGLTVFGFAFDANVFNPNTPSWTIYVEFVFYFLGALFFASTSGGRTQSRALVFALLVVLFGAAYFWPKASSLGVPIVASTFLPGQLSPLKYFPFFFLGVSIHYFLSRGNKALGFGLLALAGAWCSAFILGVRDATSLQDLSAISATQTSNLFGMAVVSGVLLVIASDWYSAAYSRLGSLPRRIDRLIGDFTYPLYLVHVPLMAALWLDQGRVRSAAAWWLSFGACLLASALLLRFVDWPVQRLRDRFRGQSLI